MRRCVAVVMLALLAGCAGSKSTESKAPQPESSAPAVRNLDESFDPSTLKEPPLPIKPRVEEKQDEFAAFLAPEAADTVQAQNVMGFRIQILQTEDADEARAAQKDAVLDFDREVYLIFDNPYYKVRVGDFAIRYDAEIALEEAIKKGYTSAWIVRTKISTAPRSPAPGQQPQ